jgi:hypothetical protein
MTDMMMMMITACVRILALAGMHIASFLPSSILCKWPNSSVGITAGSGGGRSEDRIPVVARFSAPIQTGPGAHPASCTMGTGSFPGVKRGQGVTLTPDPLLVPLS